MTITDRSKPVLVTGATGYIAGWLVKRLLEEGLTVHAAVRNPNLKAKIQPLVELAESSPGEIRFFEADLLKPGSYEAAMQGCELVFHTASPATLTVKDNQRDLIDPALEGTRNVLKSANITPSVKRVVLTSSCTAVYADAKDIESVAEGRFTEEHWNNISNLKYQPYYYSKVLAEKAAWEIARMQQQWDLVVILPSLAIGAPIGSEVTSESFNLIKQMGDGTMRAGVPAFPIATVDVRDVAETHFLAGFTPTAQGRYIASAHNGNFVALAAKLREKYGDKYPIPRGALPKWLLWMVAPIVTRGALTRKMVGRNIGLTATALDNRKSVEELGIDYRPAEPALLEMFGFMAKNKLLKR